MHSVLPLVILLGYVSRSTHAFSGGAPASICDSMIPAHSANQIPILPQQRGTQPYSFQISKSTYNAGERIQMRLAGRQGTQFGTFRGIFIKVVANTGEVVGTMVPPRGYKTINCGFNANGALTHTEGSDKPGILLTWIAPATSYGTLSVRLSIVFAYRVFWANEDIATLTPETLISPSATTVRPPLTPDTVLTTTLPTTTTSLPLTSTPKVKPTEILTNISNTSTIRMNTTNITRDSISEYYITNNSVADTRLPFSGNVTESSMNSSMTNTSKFIEEMASSIMQQRILNIADDYYAFTKPLNDDIANISFSDTSDHEIKFQSVLSNIQIKYENTTESSGKVNHLVDNFSSEILNPNSTLFSSKPLSTSTVQSSSEDIKPTLTTLEEMNEATSTAAMTDVNTDIFKTDTVLHKFKVSNNNSSTLPSEILSIQDTSNKTSRAPQADEMSTSQYITNYMPLSSTLLQNSSVDSATNISNLLQRHTTHTVETLEANFSKFSLSTASTISTSDESSTISNVSAVSMASSQIQLGLSDINTTSMGNAKSNTNVNDSDKTINQTFFQPFDTNTLKSIGVEISTLQLTVNKSTQRFKPDSPPTTKVPNVPNITLTSFPDATQQENATRLPAKTFSNSVNETSEIVNNVTTTSILTTPDNLDNETTVTEPTIPSRTANPTKFKTTHSVNTSEVANKTISHIQTDHTGAFANDITTVFNATNVGPTDHISPFAYNNTTTFNTTNVGPTDHAAVFAYDNTTTFNATNAGQTDHTAAFTYDSTTAFNTTNAIHSDDVTNKTPTTVESRPIDLSENVTVQPIGTSDIASDIKIEMQTVSVTESNVIVSTTSKESQSTLTDVRTESSTNYEDFFTDFWITSPGERETTTTLPPIIARTLRPVTRRPFIPQATDVWLNNRPSPITIRNAFKSVPTTRRVWLRLDPVVVTPAFKRPLFKAPVPPIVTRTTAPPITTSTKSEVKVVTPQQRGRIQYDPACGSSKGCFSDCKDNNCKFMVTWRDLGHAVTFELHGKPKNPDSWIAIAFSNDIKMGSDSVTECVNNGGVIQAFNSVNNGYSNARLSQFGLRDVSGSYINGVFRCKFTRIKWDQQHPYLFNLNRTWNIMFAHGNALPGFRMSMHSTEAKELPAVSVSKVDFETAAVIAINEDISRFTMVKVHGCLMIVAWVLFIGVGIATARYYKNVWSDKTILSLKIWFQIHRLCMAIALVMNIIAFIIIFVEIGGYSQIPDIPGKGYLRSHPILGIIITVLVITNPVMALFRPGPDDTKRPIFNWAHWGVGITAYILSALCICFGFELGKASTPDYAVYIMIGYIMYVVLFDVACEVHDYLAKKESKDKTESLEMKTQNGTDNGIPNGNFSTKDKKKQSDKWKTLLLVLHIAFTGAFALVLVLVVALN